MGLKAKHMPFGRKNNGAGDLEGCGWDLNVIRIHYIPILKFQTTK